MNPLLASLITAAFCWAAHVIVSIRRFSESEQEAHDQWRLGEQVGERKIWAEYVEPLKCALEKETGRPYRLRAPFDKSPETTFWAAPENTVRLARTESGKVRVGEMLTQFRARQLAAKQEA